jgi:thiol-disulfide isomerase/thioredoxin
VAFSEHNPDYTFGFTDPPALAIAVRLASAGVELGAIPALLDRAQSNSNERRQSDLASAVRPFDEQQIAMNWQIENWLVRKVRVILLARTAKPEAARTELDTLNKEVDSAPIGTNAFWRGMAAVVDAATVTQSSPIARDAIARMGSALDQDNAAAASTQQKRDHAMHEADYWEARAKLAQAEHRYLDAVAYHLRAASAKPRDFDPAGRSRLADRARSAWTALGGTQDGWMAYNPDAMGGPAAAQWRSIDRKMPEFSLEDTLGHPVRLVDLAGKTVFINVWATWCGPCQGELPWVQRLFDSLKDRRDVALLTFNVDDNPGVISPYMRERGFTFPVVLARDYVDQVMKVEAIPRNWIIDSRGVLRFERQAGFDDTFVKDTIEALARAGSR